MADYLRECFARRPFWMNLMLLFSAFMALVYLPWDLFVKPLAVDEEVWFGIRFHGGWAKLLELPHWFVYAAGTYGFWRMRPWMWPWAAAYVGQVAVGFLVWPILYTGGAQGVVMGLVGFAAFGALTFALWRARARFQKPSGSLRERYGDWALVTGASAGIGREFARALAKDGFSVVLSARREDRLRDLAGELEKSYAVSTRVVAADLSRPEEVTRLASSVADLELAVLVNNAGFGYAGRFDKLDAGRLLEMVQLNCVAPTLLTRHLLPAMRERGRGAILFTGSAAGRQPLPLHATYSATKAFDLFLGEALWGELQGTGIDVLVLEPASTETEFQEVAGEVSHAGASASSVVEDALAALGQQPSVLAGWFPWLRSTLAPRLFPRPWVALIAKDMMERQTPESMR